MIKSTILPNSISVITETLPSFASASVGIWIQSGSRDEADNLNGIAHFYEHMVFKGTKNRSAMDIVQAIESKGGYLNAYTTRESTCFYAKVIEEDLSLATEILCDMINAPLLDKGDFKKEKEVILEEVRSCIDNPDELIGDLYSLAVHHNDTLGKPIAGTVKSVKSIQIEDLEQYQKDVLTKHRMVVVGAGAVDHEKLVAWVKEFLPNKKKSTKKKRSFQDCTSKHIKRHKDISQSIISYGTQFKTATRQKKIALAVLNSILGDGMSSRLFQSVREKYGLVYSIYTSCDFYKNRIGFNVNLSAEPTKAQKAIEVVHFEMQEILKNGIPTEEIQEAKNALVGSIILNTETSNSRLNRMARFFLTEENHEDLQVTIDSIKAVTDKDVLAWLPIIFQENAWSSASILPKEKAIKLKPFCKW